MVREIKSNLEHQEIDNKRIWGHIGGSYVQWKGKPFKLGPNNAILVSILSHLTIVHPQVHYMGFLAQVSL